MNLTLIRNKNISRISFVCYGYVCPCLILKTLKPRQNGRHLQAFSNPFSCMKSIAFWTKFHINIIPTLVQKTGDQGWGLLSQFSPFRYFPYFPLLSKQTLAIEYHVYIWQVLPQLSCGDTCQIWMWFRESNRYFRNIENFAYGEISERSFSNPHPRLQAIIWTDGGLVYWRIYASLAL